MDGPCTAVYMVRTRPCTRAVKTAVSIGSTRPFTGRVLYTGRKHGRVQSTRPCTRLCSGHGRTMHGFVHGTYTAVHTGRKDGRVHGTRPVHGHVYGTYTVGYGPRTRPCFATYRLRTRPCSGHGRTMCMARVRPCTQFVHGRGRPCTVCTRPSTACTDRVHRRATAVYIVRPRPCLRPVYTAAHGRVQTVYTAVHGPRTWSVRNPITAVYAAHTRSCTVNTAVFTARVHGIVRTVYTAVHGVYGPCTSACKGRVHGASTAMYRVDLHGRVLCTRPCLRPVYTAAHGRVQTVYTAVHGPRTWSVRDPITAVYAARTRPCSVNTAVFTARVHGIVRTVNRVHAVSITETNCAQHKPSTIFMNRSS